MSSVALQSMKARIAGLLRRRGDATAAVAHLEHLILTYPQSALVPQARRELELARGTVPPARG